MPTLFVDNCGGPAAFAATGAARQLQKLAEAVAAAPATDAERVASVKRAVDSGTYEVNAERVATKIIAASREFPGR